MEQTSSDASIVAVTQYPSYCLEDGTWEINRSIALDLHTSLSRRKLPNHVSSVTGVPVLSSTDLNIVKQRSPDLGKLIFAENSALMSAPTATQINFPRNVEKGQETRARDFVETLNGEHRGTDVSSVSYATLEPRGAVGGEIIGEGSALSSETWYLQPQLECFEMNVQSPSASRPGGYPPVAPLDIKRQEEMKLEHKRQRNRIAAVKWRRRKLEKISYLENKTRLLKRENSELAIVFEKLKGEVYQLKEEVLNHVYNGCQIQY